MSHQTLRDVCVGIAVTSIILIFLIPLPPMLLDGLLTVNFGLSIITLLLTLYAENVLEFNTFPSLVLLITLFRLGLNVTSTRMILSQAKAGAMIPTFGEFVIQGNLVVGTILFVLLVVINFVVITKGAGRIAEVSARFILDALPGKQLAIDSDVAKGALSPDESKSARERIAQEADFYGAMDGASKFIRGDAIAAIIILGINIVAGVIIGMLVHQMEWTLCLQTFIRLTIGDGLVHQIPALLVSIAAGIMMTRVSRGSLGQTLPKQILQKPPILFISAAILFLMSLIPGMPMGVMLFIALALTLSGFILRSEQHQDRASSSHPLTVELGLQQIKERRKLANTFNHLIQDMKSKLGVEMPAIVISENKKLAENGFLIKAKGTTVSARERGEVEEAMKKVLLQQAPLFLTRREVLRLVDEVKKHDAPLVMELIPHKLGYGHILKILQNLLKEEVPILDFGTILEILADTLNEIKQEASLEFLSEKVRQGLSGRISEYLFGQERIAHIITLDPKVEQLIESSLNQKMGLSPILSEKFIQELRGYFQKGVKDGIRPVLMTTSSARLHMRKLLFRKLPEMPVLSFEELHGGVEVHPIGFVTQEVLNADVRMKS